MNTKYLLKISCSQLNNNTCKFQVFPDPDWDLATFKSFIGTEFEKHYPEKKRISVVRLRDSDKCDVPDWTQSTIKDHFPSHSFVFVTTRDDDDEEGRDISAGILLNNDASPTQQKTPNLDVADELISPSSSSTPTITPQTVITPKELNFEDQLMEESTNGTVNPNDETDVVDDSEGESPIKSNLQQQQQGTKRKLEQREEQDFSEEEEEEDTTELKNQLIQFVQENYSGTELVQPLRKTFWKKFRQLNTNDGQQVRQVIKDLHEKYQQSKQSTSKHKGESSQANSQTKKSPKTKPGSGGKQTTLNFNKNK
jgi:hypothetical protein